MKLSEFSLATLYSWCPTHYVLYNTVIYVTCGSTLLYSEAVFVLVWGTRPSPLGTGHGEWTDRSREHCLNFLGLMSKLQTEPVQGGLSVEMHARLFLVVHGEA